MSAGWARAPRFTVTVTVTVTGEPGSGKRGMETTQLVEGLLGLAVVARDDGYGYDAVRRLRALMASDPPLSSSRRDAGAPAASGDR